MWKLESVWVRSVFLVGLAMLAGPAAGRAESTTVDPKPLEFGAKMFRPGAIWQDDHGVAINAHGGGMLERDGTYYWFGEHKIAGAKGNSAQVGVHAYSSQNLHDWKDEGIALAVTDDPKSEIVRGAVVERPKVIFCAKTGKFVMWFHLELKDRGYAAARSGVAVADEITGPYRYLGSFRPNAGRWPKNVPARFQTPQPDEAAHPELGSLDTLRRDFAGGQMARDMTLFVDADGAAYLVCASEENQTLQISRLTDDYLRPTGDYVRAFPGAANEAPAIFKKDGKYFLITSGCTGWAPNAARSAVADAVMGPWRALGNPCRGPEAQTTFDAQSTFVLPAPGKPGEFIFMADRWRPENAIDGRYVWLPIAFEDGRPVIEWRDEWDLKAIKKLPTKNR